MILFSVSFAFVHFDWGYHACIYYCIFFGAREYMWVSRYLENVSVLLFLVKVLLVHNLAVDSSLSSNFLSHQFEMLSKIKKTSFSSATAAVSCPLKDQRLFYIVDLKLNDWLYKFMLTAFIVFWSLSKYDRWNFVFVITTGPEWENILGRDIIPEAHRLCS